jgi:RNA polymerase sigma-70 factor (ECF subfamily)
VVPSSLQLVSLVSADRRVGRALAWSPADDVPLVQAAQAGESASFDALYRRHARIVRAVLLGRSTREDVDDLVQEVFLTAWRQLGTLRDPAAFAGWVMTIARHQRIDHARRQPAGARDISTTGAREAAGLDVKSPDAGADVRLEARLALDAIRALPEAYRETLVLRLVEGMTGPEIASRTGLTPDSVRVNLCRGMKLLRDALLGASARTR